MIELGRWVRAGDAASRLGITQHQLFLLLDEMGEVVQVDREQHSVVVPLAAVDVLSARRPRPDAPLGHS